VNTLISAGAEVDQEDEVKSRKCMNLQGSQLMASLCKIFITTACSGSQKQLSSFSETINEL